MTHKVPAGRTLRVEALARVEGEGAMHVETRDDEVVDVQLRIYEPPRFFEAFLRGRAHTEPPDLTARICGICPVAYQMSACRAIEDACGYELDASGTIVDARIVPPTSQNQPTIEHDLWHVVEGSLDLDDAALTRRCEQTIRNYDPCISCAAHFLDLTRTDR